MSNSFKGLTHKQIDRRLKEGRGQNSGQDYKPFIYTHEVSSDGRVHRIFGQKSQRINHLLSDLELAVFLMLDWHQDVVDVREQFPMLLHDTIRIAEESGLPHQKYKGVYQVLTSDFVVDSQNLDMPRLALQVKYAEDLGDKKTIQRLELERRYWHYKRVPWYLITQKEIPKTVLNNIQWLYPAKKREIFNQDLQHYYAIFIDEFNRAPLQNLITTTQKLDIAYQLEKGEALYWLRSLLALRFFVFDLQIPYRNLVASDLGKNGHQEDEVVYAFA
ncbi:TnsA endonuclease C-terminal domain-containing protein [Thalassotalea euphylliae]|uniref:Heteromeric transposase endonuclease subunit TnsA n=1 Tax=Thalassotalea euphylliae TaxID=1655234 RepID=A0A3E0U3J1_9GAMM|nr:TnsA endonuclease C-terminal domain-containing protein [Thalassotalea euphylliae]REL31284.1 heteromeric transposase endonuclease subunit TnsA [Thalassotalea euphylliae]